MDIFWGLSFVLCTVVMTAVWSRFLPRIRWWWHALIGCALGMALYWGLVIVITGHLDKFFLLTLFPLLAISGCIAAFIAFVLSGLRK